MFDDGIFPRQESLELGSLQFPMTAIGHVTNCLYPIITLNRHYGTEFYEGDRKFPTPLSVYHTMPTFDANEEKTFRKHCGKRRKCW